MKEHLTEIDADIIGMNDIDSISGDNPEAVTMLAHMMDELGYAFQYN